jgi:hypothetical protein
MTNQEWNFIFFRSGPATEASLAALTSSMQTFESTLLLVGLYRYPQALAACATAIESAIISSPAGALTEPGTGLRKAFRQARRHATGLGAFPKQLLDEFTDTRNRFTHDGFSPRDDGEAIRLLIEVGFPFLALCLQHLYSFDLMDAILQEYSEQLRIATTVFHQAEKVRGLDWSYSINGLAHLIKWGLKDNFSADWEITLIDRDNTGFQYEFNQKRREKMERLYNAFWAVKRPLCDQPDSAICELDEEELDLLNVIPRRMACVNCGFVVNKSQPFLCEALIGAVVVKDKDAILKEYGLG